MAFCLLFCVRKFTTNSIFRTGKLRSCANRNTPFSKFQPFFKNRQFSPNRSAYSRQNRHSAPLFSHSVLLILSNNIFARLKFFFICGKIHAPFFAPNSLHFPIFSPIPSQILARLSKRRSQGTAKYRPFQPKLSPPTFLPLCYNNKDDNPNSQKPRHGRGQKSSAHRSLCQFQSPTPIINFT